MNTKHFNLTRFNKCLLSLLLASLLLYFGKPFLVPIAVAAFFAMLLFPMVQKLQKYNIKESVAALLAILVLLVCFVLLGTIIYYQISSLESDLPRLEERIESKTQRLQWLLYETTDLTEYEQDKILEEKKPDIVKAAVKKVRDFFVGSLTLLILLFIVFTYTFFFLIYHQKIQTFLVQLQLFDGPKESKILLARISRIIHHYLKGIFTVISIMGVVYALGFWAIGLEHALLFALITALLRIVPYFGSFLGIAFPIAFAFLTKDSLWYPALILFFFMVTQVLEANLLTPYITGSRVKLNPLATIMVILLGSLVWGVPGMILFVPLFASLKIIFDRVPHLNPYGYILGRDEDNNQINKTPSDAVV